MGTSLRKMYDAELMALDTMLARMGHAAGGAIESAMTALRTGDAELARSVIARDSEIDSAEHEIEHRCLTLFLRQQPVAAVGMEIAVMQSHIVKAQVVAQRMDVHFADALGIVARLAQFPSQRVGIVPRH